MLKRAMEGSSLAAQLKEFLAEFQRESDRAAAVLGAAYLDDRLGVLLREKFVAVPAFVEELFRGQGGLSSFSAKISICYAVGLMTRGASHDLHIVRKIRNDFAHKPHGISFKTKEIANRVNSLETLKLLHEEKNKLFPVPTDRRQRFNLVLAILLVNGIEKRIREMPKFQEAKRPDDEAAQ
jgi:DNA-binding MltR family transcriptional regulator